MGIRIEPTTFPVIPTADYVAKIVDIAEVQSEYNGETRERLRFRFDVGQVEDEDGEIVDGIVPGYTSLALSPKSNLWKLAVAAGLDPSHGLDCDDLLGKRVTIPVTVGVRDDGTHRNTIDMANVRPAKGTGKKVSTTGKAAEQPVAVAAVAPPVWATEDIPF